MTSRLNGSREEIVEVAASHQRLILQTQTQPLQEGLVVTVLTMNLLGMEMRVLACKQLMVFHGVSKKIAS